MQTYSRLFHALSLLSFSVLWGACQGSSEEVAWFADQSLLHRLEVSVSVKNCEAYLPLKDNNGYLAPLMLETTLTGKGKDDEGKPSSGSQTYSIVAYNGSSSELNLFAADNINVPDNMAADTSESIGRKLFFSRDGVEQVQLKLTLPNAIRKDGRILHFVAAGEERRGVYRPYDDGPGDLLYRYSESDAVPDSRTNIYVDLGTREIRFMDTDSLGSHFAYTNEYVDFKAIRPVSVATDFHAGTLVANFDCNLHSDE